jgi:hypothetical protein
MYSDPVGFSCYAPSTIRSGTRVFAFNKDITNRNLILEIQVTDPFLPLKLN